MSNLFFCDFSNDLKCGVDLSLDQDTVRGWGGWLALAWLVAAFAPPRMLLTLFHLSFHRTSLACARWVRVGVVVFLASLKARSLSGVSQ